MKPSSSDFICQAFGLGETPIELYKGTQEGGKKAGLSAERTIEAALWLPHAAKVYNLSNDLRDYVLVPVPVIISDMPNTNGDSVSIHELLRFDPELGQQAFKTFRGKPCHLEHANQIITNAKGVILDVFLRPMPRFGNGKYFKMVELMAYDRTKDPLLVNSILKRENNSYSVGFYFKSYTCSVCGQRAGQAIKTGFCEHTRPRRPTYQQPNGHLVYRRCEYIQGFETSVVDNPSYSVAIGPHVMDAASA